ncbi:hypothetical protein GCM10027275_51980 [Rhabdobacter roseus]|uniref:Uncharacterized protein n=1 Tax=Rhabdobacter roseus TaxID=1655419 RepID=A0A840U116_9BACT|nr:hypothetical protein [Rhabdobacter roseus]MBB5287273.1 hypothetical protein [Rhabdobacter roseus]
MKKRRYVAVTALLFLALLATPGFGQSTHLGLPLLKANSSKLSVRIGNVVVDGLWTLKPDYKLNTLQVELRKQKEWIGIYTDLDSASYEVRPGQTTQFYVLLNKQYVLSEVQGIKEERQGNRLLNIDKPRSKTFGTLWEKHNVDGVVEDINNYADKASGFYKRVKNLFGSD